MFPFRILHVHFSPKYSEKRTSRKVRLVILSFFDFSAPSLY